MSNLNLYVCEMIHGMLILFILFFKLFNEFLNDMKKKNKISLEKQKSIYLVLHLRAAFLHLYPISILYLRTKEKRLRTAAATGSLLQYSANPPDTSGLFCCVICCRRRICISPSRSYHLACSRQSNRCVCVRACLRARRAPAHVLHRFGITQPAGQVVPPRRWRSWGSEFRSPRP